MRDITKSKLGSLSIILVAVGIFLAIMIPQFLSAAAEYEERKPEDPNYIQCDSCGSDMNIAIAKL